jgi:REP element-mobilizing transposase RayT
MYADDGVYFVTARTFQARMLLRPSPAVNDVIGGVLARAVSRFDVELYGFVFASNHMHLLVRARNGSLSAFMQYLLGNLSRKVGRLVSWTGALWERRFSAEAVLDDAALMNGLKYIIAHGVKEGLVKRVTEWPGLSCVTQLLGQHARTFRWFHWARRWTKGKLKAAGNDLLSDEWAETVELELTPPPSWASLPAEKRKRLAEKLVEIVEAEGSARPGRVIGREAVLALSPHTRPRRRKKSPRPLCHSSHFGMKREFLDTYRAFCAAYHGAAARFRRGDWSAVFPGRAFRPPGFPREHVR